jgi:hypothetical protein
MCNGQKKVKSISYTKICVVKITFDFNNKTLNQGFHSITQKNVQIQKTKIKALGLPLRHFVSIFFLASIFPCFQKMITIRKELKMNQKSDETVARAAFLLEETSRKKTIQQHY